MAYPVIGDLPSVGLTGDRDYQYDYICTVGPHTLAVYRASE
jgi:hypothetical protein